MTKLRQLQSTPATGTLCPAEAIAGDWPPSCQAFPASYAQSRLWFLQQLQPDLTAYHLPQLWILHGVLDLKALRLALADLIARHPTLRTSFRLHDGAVPGPIRSWTKPLRGRLQDFSIS